jgi:hypothetical protein
VHIKSFSLHIFCHPREINLCPVEFGWKGFEQLFLVLGWLLAPSTNCIAARHQGKFAMVAYKPLFLPISFALVFAARNKLPEFLEQLVIHAEVALDLFLAINSILFGSDGSCLLPLLLGEHGGYSVCCDSYTF